MAPVLTGLFKDGCRRRCVQGRANQRFQGPQRPSSTPGRGAARGGAICAQTRAGARPHARGAYAVWRGGATRRRARRFGQCKPFVERRLCGARLGGDPPPQILSRGRAVFGRAGIGRHRLFDRPLGRDKIALYHSLIREQRARHGGGSDARVLPPAAAARWKLPRLDDHPFQFRMMKNASARRVE